MLTQIDVICSTSPILPLQIACDHHGQQERADTTMVRLVELARLQEAFKDEEHRSQLRVLLQQLFDEFDTINAILSVEANVDIDRCLFVLQLDDGHLGVFDWLDGGADVRADELRGDAIDHRELSHGWIVY